MLMYYGKALVGAKKRKDPKKVSNIRKTEQMWQKLRCIRILDPGLLTQGTQSEKSKQAIVVLQHFESNHFLTFLTKPTPSLLLFLQSGSFSDHPIRR